MSKEREAVTAENFKRRVSNVVRSGKSIRANIQELFHYGVVLYLDPANNGNSEPLTYLYTEVSGVKSLNHNQLATAICDTVNLSLGKTKAGEPVFKKSKKGEAPALRDDADLAANWWEISRETAPRDVDIAKVIASALKQLESTQGEEAKRALTEGQQVVVADVISKLDDLAVWAKSAADIRNAAADAREGSVVTEIAA